MQIYRYNNRIKLTLKNLTISFKTLMYLTCNRRDYYFTKHLCNSKKH